MFIDVEGYHRRYRRGGGKRGGNSWIWKTILLVVLENGAILGLEKKFPDWGLVLAGALLVTFEVVFLFSGKKKETNFRAMLLWSIWGLFIATTLLAGDFWSIALYVCAGVNILNICINRFIFEY